MTDFRGNIDHWLKQSEPDYYTFFLKAWIPFNAWYVAEMPQHNKKDSKLIKELQDNVASKPRKIIENYLTNNNDYESKQFRVHLAELHHHLYSKTLTHNCTKLDFTTLSLSENPLKHKNDTDRYRNVYKAEVTTNYIQALIVAKGGQSMLDFKRPHYAIEELKNDIYFIRLGKKSIQNKILQCYKAINPNKSINLVTTSSVKSEYILLDSLNKVKFINDPTTIAKGCIKTLYALRCMLFHGELEPNSYNKPVYEHAYYLLRFIIKNLN